MGYGHPQILNLTALATRLKARKHQIHRGHAVKNSARPAAVLAYRQNFHNIRVTRSAHHFAPGEQQRIVF